MKLRANVCVEWERERERVYKEITTNDEKRKMSYFIILIYLFLFSHFDQVHVDKNSIRSLLSPSNKHGLLRHCPVWFVSQKNSKHFWIMLCISTIRTSIGTFSLFHSSMLSSEALNCKFILIECYGIIKLIYFYFVPALCRLVTCCWASVSI